MAEGCSPTIENVREPFTKGVRALGVFPVYPLRETMRVGQILVADGSAATPNATQKPGYQATVLLTDELVRPMEDARLRRLKEIGRFAATPATGKPSEDAAYYFKPDPKDDLGLIGIPQYSLASIDQASLGGAGSTPFASFLAAFGFAQSKYLTMEAVATQMAELPLADFTSVVQKACLNGSGMFGKRRPGHPAEILAYNFMKANHDIVESGNSSPPKFQPEMMVMRRVYYLRGIRYVFNDASVASAIATAAFNTRLPTTAAPPDLLKPTPSTGSAATENLPTDDKATKALIASITALNKQLSEIKDVVAAGKGGAGFGISGVRATARGIEMTQTFNRPLAFGYEPITFNFGLEKDQNGVVRRTGGLDELCTDSGA